MLTKDGIAVSRMHKVTGDTKLKAFVDITVSGWTIKGLRIVAGKNGLFLGMPQSQGKDGKWYDTVTLESPEMKNELTAAVLAAYQE
jgi:DNA-binding cell septation regulator SpoVG